MAWPRRAAILAVAVAAFAATVCGELAAAPTAHANVPCDVATGGVGVVTGVVGIGNPVGDACDAVTDPVVNPVEDAVGEAAGAVGGAVFDQITSWATDGAMWLLGEIVELTEKTTTPNLLSHGFVKQYRQMASIAVVLALAMLLLAAVEGLGRGDPGMLWRVFLVNAPVAALATSAAYVVIQLLVATSDGFSEVMTHTAGHDTREFFKTAIDGLSAAGGSAAQTGGELEAGPVSPAKHAAGAVSGAAGSVEVPLFVGFIAAMVAAFAAFLVWIELLMRSAAIYAVALFMPLAIAASIWPRWQSALKRTCELIVVLVFSKMVIVAIIGLAASLAAKGEGVESVLAAGALLLVACFSPLVLLKLAPFAEGAISSAFSRQSAGGTAIRTVEMGSNVAMLKRTAFANWGSGGPEGSASAGGGKGSGDGSATTGGRGGGGGGAAAGEAGGVAAMPVAAGVTAAKSAKAGGERLAATGTAEAASESHERPSEGRGESQPKLFTQPGSGAGNGAEERPPGAMAPAAAEEGREAPAPRSAPAPAGADGGSAPEGSHKAPRPGGDAGTASTPKPSSGAGAGEAAS
jgi:type IV secretion system protein TrbL